ncbi:hypothetical protein BKA70DRAFT_1274788 [Coprinopsis sp. MPI-PUGE-AT-0042]|nr:hypothetical protein BKA70DRAFT_1274788 [Coprinopsis sp. MPI-PUGE-AT-0042]
MNGIQLQKLPVEVLVEIAENLPRESILHLSLMSRLFNGVAARILYRTLFLRGVGVNSASLVRDLSVHLNTSSPEIEDKLTLVWEGLPYASMSDVSFPRLVAFHASQDLDDDLARFIESNPQLEALTLSGKSVLLSRKLSLPSLRFYAGPCQVDTLKVACVCNPPCKTAFLEAVTTPPKRLGFSNLSYESPDPILRLIETKFANLTSLEFRSVKRDDWSPGGALYQGFTRILPHLNRLQRLDAGHVGGLRGPPFRQLEQGFAWVSKFAAVQDSLCVVVTGDVQWGRLRHWRSWVPVMDDLVMLEWLLRRSGMLTRLWHAARFKRESQSTRQAIVGTINCAFGFDPSQETLQVPVRSTQGHDLKPYIDRDPLPSKGISPSGLWDGFVSAIGRFPLILFVGGTETDELPLDEGQRELFRLVLDTVWASIHVTPIDMARYLQNPEKEWDGAALYFPYSSLFY